LDKHGFVFVLDLNSGLIESRKEFNFFPESALGCFLVRLGDLEIHNCQLFSSKILYCLSSGNFQSLNLEKENLETDPHSATLKRIQNHKIALDPDMHWHSSKGLNLDPDPDNWM
jgi:hypothetical protein